ncbi:MAG: ferrous iron transport protein A [Clostridia bacterium]|nr:ferrous iron transport protein A [Clostridia bacterium]MCL6521548.1 ferrous iron transport protein A [Bacillota bacterium]
MDGGLRAEGRGLPSLAALGDGEEGRIAALGGPAPFRRRLAALGLLPGSRLRRLGAMPAGGPLMVEVGGTRLALRRRDAAAILVEPRGEGGAA